MVHALVIVCSLISLQVSINSLVVAFTSPSSLLRPAALPVLFLCMYTVLPLCMEASGRVMYASMLAAQSVSFLFQYLDTALINQWSCETNGPRQEKFHMRRGRPSVQVNPFQTKTTLQRLRFGLHAATSTRFVGTPNEVFGVPRFSEENPNYTPSKVTFFREKAIMVALCYLTMDLLTTIPPPENGDKLFHDDRVSWLRTDNFTLEALVVRMMSVLTYGLSVYCLVQVFMGTLAIITVALGLSEPRYWPPAFGPLKEAYSIRRFWG